MNTYRVTLRFNHERTVVADSEKAAEEIAKECWGPEFISVEFLRNNS